jgi:hypothetical protein
MPSPAPIESTSSCPLNSPGRKHRQKPWDFAPLAPKNYGARNLAGGGRGTGFEPSPICARLQPGKDQKASILGQIQSSWGEPRRNLSDSLIQSRRPATFATGPAISARPRASRLACPAGGEWHPVAGSLASRIDCRMTVANPATGLGLYQDSARWVSPADRDHALFGLIQSAHDNLHVAPVAI